MARPSTRVIPSPNPQCASNPGGGAHPGRAGQSRCKPPAWVLPTFSLGREGLQRLLKAITGKGTPPRVPLQGHLGPPQPRLCWGDLREQFGRRSCVQAC